MGLAFAHGWRSDQLLHVSFFFPSCTTTQFSSCVTKTVGRPDFLRYPPLAMYAWQIQKSESGSLLH